MDNKKKIDFNETRNFGDKINVTFAYVSQNFKSLSLSMIYIIAPLMLIGGIVYAFLFNGNINSMLENAWGGPTDISIGQAQTTIVAGIAFMIVSVIAGSLIVTIVYSHMMIYKENELRPIEVSEVWERVKKEFSSILGIQIGLVLILGFAGAIVGGIMIGIPAAMDSIFLAVMGGFCFFILVMYVAIGVSLCFIIRFNEKANFFEVIQRSIYLIKGKWWSTFGLLFIMNMIAGMLSYVFAIPLYVVSFADMFHGIMEGSGAFEPSGEVSIVGIITSTIYLFGSYLMYSLPLIAISFQYFNLVEMKEATGLMDQIQSIGEEQTGEDAEEDY